MEETRHFSCFVPNKSENGWFTDTVATRRMVSYIKGLDSFTNYFDPSQFVTIPNGHKVNISKVGNVKLSRDIVLRNVLYVCS